MRSSKIVSVIIPTYNRASYIRDAIDSVLSQSTDWDIEVIVVDDGSTDDTEEIIRQYRSKIKYLKIPHSGKPAVARNAGIKIANGDLIAFQDSDDLWAKGKLKTQLKLFENNSIVMSYGNAVYMDELGTVSDKEVVAPNMLDYGEDFATLVECNAISTLTVVIRTSVMEELMFDESDNLRAVEDYHLWLRLLDKYPNKIKSINKVLAYYRKHDQNISGEGELLGYQRIINVINSLLKQKSLNSRNKEILRDYLDIYKNKLINTSSPTPAISVVMSVYNGGGFLRSSIDSILNQTFKDFEFIIINDGSTDGSRKVIESYKDPRIRLYNQSNKGLVYSLNKGCELARANLIARMDADDISMPSRLEKQVKLMSMNKDLVLVGGFFAYINNEGDITGKGVVNPVKDIDLKRSLYSVNPFAHGCTMFRRECWKKNGGYTDKYGPTEDLELWRRFADDESNMFYIIPETLYLYRLNPEGISSMQNSDQIKYTHKIINEQWNKQYIGKRIRDIVKDGQYYRMISPTIGHEIEDVYYCQQISIMERLFDDRHFYSGVKQAIGALRLKPKWGRKKIIKQVIRGFARKVRLK